MGSFPARQLLFSLLQLPPWHFARILGVIVVPRRVPLLCHRDRYNGMLEFGISPLMAPLMRSTEPMYGCGSSRAFCVTSKRGQRQHKGMIGKQKISPIDWTRNCMSLCYCKASMYIIASSIEPVASRYVVVTHSRTSLTCICTLWICTHRRH
jgi:hypothetical protein